jgi:CO dehydrogenase nickel-insertion accessory protein CooC1
MNKAILIIGEGGSGKSTVSRIIASCFSNYHLVCGNVNLVVFDEDPECIIFEEVKIDAIEDYFNYITEGITIKKPRHQVKHIYPKKIIINCLANPKIADELMQQASFRERFDVIQLSIRKS